MSNKDEHVYETPKNTSVKTKQQFTSNKKIPAPSPPPPTQQINHNNSKQKSPQTEVSVEIIKNSKHYTRYKHTRHVTENEKIYETITTSSKPEKTTNKASKEKTTFSTTEIHKEGPSKSKKRYFESDVRLLNTEDSVSRSMQDHHKSKTQKEKKKDGLVNQEESPPEPLNRSTANNSPTLTDSNDSIYKSAMSTLSDLDKLSVSNLSLNSIHNQYDVPIKLLNDNASLKSLPRTSNPKFDSEFEKLLQMQSDLINQFTVVDQLRKQYASKKGSISKTPDKLLSRQLTPEPPITKSHIKREPSLPADPTPNFIQPPSRHSSRPASVMSNQSSRPPSVMSNQESRPVSVMSNHSVKAPSVMLNQLSRPPSVMSNQDSRPPSVMSNHSVQAPVIVSHHSKPASIASHHSAKAPSIASHHSKPASIVSHHSTKAPSIVSHHSVQAPSIASHHSKPVSIASHHSVKAPSIASHHSKPVSIASQHPNKPASIASHHSTKTPSIASHHSKPASIKSISQKSEPRHSPFLVEPSEPSEYVVIGGQSQTYSAYNPVHHAEMLASKKKNKDLDYEEVKSLRSLRNEPHEAVEVLHQPQHKPVYEVNDNRSRHSKRPSNASEVVQWPIVASYHPVQTIEKDDHRSVKSLRSETQRRPSAIYRSDSTSQRSKHSNDAQNKDSDNESVKTLRNETQKAPNLTDEKQPIDERSRHSSKRSDVNGPSSDYKTVHLSDKEENDYESIKSLPQSKAPSIRSNKSERSIDVKSHKSLNNANVYHAVHDEPQNEENEYEEIKSLRSLKIDAHEIYEEPKEELMPDSSFEQIPNIPAPPPPKNEEKAETPPHNNRPKTRPPAPPLPNFATMKLPVKITPNPQRPQISHPIPIQKKTLSPQTPDGWDEILKEIRAVGEQKRLSEEEEEKKKYPSDYLPIL